MSTHPRNTTSRQCIGKITQVCKSFNDKQVLSNIDLALYQGEVLAVLGPNGAGKTTLINTMLGKISLSKGEISLFGHEPGSMPVKRQIGAMLQVAGLPDMSTIKEHIQLFQAYYANPMDYNKVLEIAGLKEIENQYSKNLSGGQKQRLLFALAICGNPKLLFLDEPSVGMDITARKSLWRAIEMLRAQGTSILLTTHYLEEADQLSDRIVMINRGRIVREGTSDEIKSQINTKKIRFKSPVDIQSLLALESVDKASKTSNYYELESKCAEKTLSEIIGKQIIIEDLTVTGAALEDAFELINGQEKITEAA
ncbi:MAG: ABC transporter ATP-binding protein [Kangiellaceae bacterium]|nr:ABC transporter ATP-binding protein [Kangiellaceae bacterium]